MILPTFESSLPSPFKEMTASERLQFELERSTPFTPLILFLHDPPNLVTRGKIGKAFLAEMGELRLHTKIVRFGIKPETYLEPRYGPGRGEVGHSAVTVVKVWYYQSRN